VNVILVTLIVFRIEYQAVIDHIKKQENEVADKADNGFSCVQILSIIYTL
jgi:hypothetical protein